MDGIELLVRHTDTERWTLKKNKEKEEEKKNNKHWRHTDMKMSTLVYYVQEFPCKLLNFE